MIKINKMLMFQFDPKEVIVGAIYTNFKTLQLGNLIKLAYFASVL